MGLLVFMVVMMMAASAWSELGAEISLRNKVTKMSSVYFGYGSSNAVDGSTDGEFWSGSCSHTEESENNPWWSVDQGVSNCIGKIELYNRQDCCEDRIVGAVVRIGDREDFNQNPQCGEPVSRAQMEKGQRIDVHCNLEGRYISVHLSGYEPLTLCEVKAFACSPTPTPDVPTDCVDVYEDCLEYENVCHNNSGVWLGCPKTCGRCEDSVDYDHEWCYGFKDYCHDKDFEEVTKFCPKTCNVCGGNPSVCVDKAVCSNYEDIHVHMCETYVQFAADCPNTCEVCKENPDCKDLHEDCPSEKDHCLLWGLAKVCPKTCGKC